MVSGVQGIVFGEDSARPWLAQRSVRSLHEAGLQDVRVIATDADWPEPSSHVLLIRAGAWLRKPGPLKLPPSSATGRGLLALGHAFSGKDSPQWHEERRQSGGHFELPPPLVCAALDSVAMGACPLVDLIQGRYDHSALRIVHWPALDVDDDDRLRCLQVVTSLQHGGAERVALDLANELPRQGVPTRLVVLGRPLRRKLPEPPGLIDLGGLSRERRALAMRQTVALTGSDVIHAHLIDAEDARLFSAIGTPLVMTIHNTRAAWPEGLETLRRGDVALWIACAQMVERELKQCSFTIPIRTVWNGIRTEDVAKAVAQSSARKEPGSFTLLCIANPRPQKRLHLLPAILAATRAAFARQGSRLEVKMILAGETSPLSPSAIECMERTLAEAQRLGVADHFHVTEGCEEIPDVLARSDAMVCCSAYEGLSLAHLEGLAAGLRLITTDAGGANELAWRNEAVTLLPLDATAEMFADAVTEGLEVSSLAALDDFTTQRMAGRCHWFYRRLVQGEGRSASTVWFITNNLSTGGAQSSLRRLVKALHLEGRSVKVAVLQEDHDNPTPGTRDLEAAGIPVLALPKAGTLDAAEAVELLFEAWRGEPPAAVMFWNAIPVYKMLIADGALNARIYDVSPGEMFFASLAKYFDKPRPALPYRTPRDYGARLSGAVVKYGRETKQAEDTLGAKTFVIPNGINIPHTPPRLPSPTLRIGTAARINPQKKLEDLLRAFRLALPNLPPCVLKIAGGVEIDCDDYAQQLRDLSADLPVEWLGDVQDIAAFHAELDVFAMISEPSGCPNASLEAMASGLPVIATDVGGVNEQVIDGFNGRLIAPRDDEAFAAALVEVCSDESKRHRMGHAALKHVRERFSMECMTDAYRALLFPEG
jgi:glycosyltransferase involved in cell wall biosynthesis